jgi:hypothetical protein
MPEIITYGKSERFQIGLNLIEFYVIHNKLLVLYMECDAFFLAKSMDCIPFFSVIYVEYNP